MYNSWGKQFLDVVIALIALIVLSPLMLLVTVLIPLFDPGSVIFRQERIGKNGRQFILLKFRSMPINTENVPSDKVEEISISWLGRLIRRTNIDELPQLFNILMGDMSIVGPRPSLPQQNKLTGLRRVNGSLNCYPGLTGLAQVYSFDGMSYTEKAILDGRYAQNITLWGDLKIIFQTFLYLLKPPPVY